MQHLNNLSIQQDPQEPWSPLKIINESDNPIDYKLLDFSMVEQKQEASRNSLEQSEINMGQESKIEIENSKIDVKMNDVTVSESLEGELSVMEGLPQLKLWQSDNSQLQSSNEQFPNKTDYSRTKPNLQQSLLLFSDPSNSQSYQKSQQIQNSNMFEQPSSINHNLLCNSQLNEYQLQQSEDVSYSKILQQIMLQQSIFNLTTLSAISTYEMEKLMEHIQKHIEHLSLFYPQEINYLKNILNYDGLQLLRTFKRVFPIKLTKSRLNKQLPPELKKYSNRYKHYKLQDPKIGQYSKYLILSKSSLYSILDLSFQQIHLPKLLQCNWQNIIELNLKYCGIDNMGWLQLVARIHVFDQLRKVNVGLNQITLVKQQDFHPFLQLKHLIQLDMRQNPFQKNCFRPLILTKKLINKKFSFEYTMSQFHMEHFKWQNFLKLEKDDLKLINKISWINKKFDNSQWKLFVDQFKLLESLNYIDLSENIIQNILFNELFYLNLILEKDHSIERKLQIILEKNTLSKESLTVLEQFYQQFKWSKLCIIYKKFNNQFHQQRLINIKVKNQVSLIFLMALKSRPQTVIDEELKNLRFKIEDIVMNNNENELSLKQYLQRIVDYVLEEMKRVHEEKKMVKPKFLEDVQKIKKWMFKDYEKAISLAKENNMVQLL